MKKLIFASALLMATLTASAGVTLQKDTACVLKQEEVYKKIKVTDIPKEVLDKIHKNYGDYEIKEAYKSDQGNYKLMLMKDGIGLTASFTKGGDLIKIYS